MTSFEALRLFAAQIERRIASDKFRVKVVLTPSSIDEKGLVIKISALKSYLQSEPRGVRSSRFLRTRVSVAGAAESLAGLEQALDAVEALDGYLGQNGLRLENMDGEGVANTRIIQTISQEDSFLDSPDENAAQDVQDDRIVTITFPTGGGE
jgi:hypothetical protein